MPIMKQFLVFFDRATERLMPTRVFRRIIIHKAWVVVDLIVCIVGLRVRSFTWQCYLTHCLIFAVLYCAF